MPKKDKKTNQWPKNYKLPKSKRLINYDDKSFSDSLSSANGNLVFECGGCNRKFVFSGGEDVPKVFTLIGKPKYIPAESTESKTSKTVTYHADYCPECISLEKIKEISVHDPAVWIEAFEEYEEMLNNKYIAFLMK